MNNIEIEIAQDVKDYVKHVSDSCPNHDVYLVGGYLRDNYTAKLNNTFNVFDYKTWRGIAPKDVDIVLVPTVSYDCAVPVESAIGTFVVYNKPCTDDDMAKRGVQNLIGLSKYDLSTRDVQLIVYNKFLSAEQVMLDMDMNVVQALYDPQEDKTIVSDSFIKGHNEKVIECLHTYDEERMFVRYERMEKKLKGYTTKGKSAIVISKKRRKAIRRSHSNSI